MTDHTDLWTLPPTRAELADDSTPEPTEPESAPGTVQRDVEAGPNGPPEPDSATETEPEPGPNGTPADPHEHDQAELHAVERVVLELVRSGSRRTRRRILAMLGELEAPR